MMILFCKPTSRKQTEEEGYGGVPKRVVDMLVITYSKNIISTFSKSISVYDFIFREQRLHQYTTLFSK